MINKEFNKLIPYVSENFITYPLAEEGIYLPFLNFWCIDKKTVNKVKKFKNDNYEINTHWSSTIFDTTQHYTISPKFEYNDELGYVLIKEDWSIEEMIQIIIKLLNL